MNDLISEMMNALARKSAGSLSRVETQKLADEVLDFEQPWDAIPEWEPDGPIFGEGDEVKDAGVDEEVTPIIPIV